jgi:hypothetical protein
MLCYCYRYRALLYRYILLLHYTAYVPLYMSCIIVVVCREYHEYLVTGIRKARYRVVVVGSAATVVQCCYRGTTTPPPCYIAYRFCVPQEVLQESNATHISCTPSLWKLFDGEPEECPALTCVALGG